MGWEMDWINNRARLTPDRVAIIDADRNDTYTYAEVNDRACTLANWFLNQGVQKGDRVALLSPNHLAYFDILFACAKIGAIFVPLNWRLSNEELHYILGDCTPVLIGYHTQFSGKIGQLSRDNDRFFCIDTAEYTAVFHNKSNLEFEAILIEEDPLAMIYTGGTTGKPKGVVLAHRSIMYNAINTVLSWNLNESDCTLSSMPMFHTGGLNVLSIPLLFIGGRVVITAAFDPVKSIEYLNRYNCTVVIFVPTMYHMMFQTEEFKLSTFPSIRLFLSGGAPCPLEVYDMFQKKGIAFKEGYGLTEAGPNNFYIEPSVANNKRGSVGKPMLFNMVKLVTEDGREAGPHEVGEILIKGKHVFREYWNNPDATAESLQDGWLHTGDLGQKDEEGFFYIVGRKKDMIITGGENVYPLEIEHWLESHPEIDEAAVIGLPDLKWGEVVTAFVAVTNPILNQVELAAFCQQKLGKYKIPRKFIFVDELPKTHVGKIDKKRLKEIGLEATKVNESR
ncbi:long-chain fatty acid--CoA ligase [Bacillus sp. DNRA2]|uniref:acyl-CoA synthetase n=1 Tax=Bacillus sp. DNRA2 TaxID=2723053 RepID=UPI00145E1BDA|nr:long-chain fatty acid--CoA ligase [Bacillus sp. DNRA2]NMD70873.1 long-chain fatty acid--CoA ligase [Bacillus sp. DNRA2]